jgi:hypothetical protein
MSHNGKFSDEDHISNSDVEEDDPNDAISPYKEAIIPYDEEEDDEDIPDELKIKKILDIDEKILSEGIDDIEYIKKDINFHKYIFKNCTYCFKFYDLEMIADSYADEIMCWHCFFWINHDISLRKNCDGTLGMTVVDYIKKCHEVHDTTKCKRQTDQGGCFLCEYKVGMKITDIKDIYKLYPEEEQHIKIVESSDLNEYGEICEEVTVYI